MAEEKFKRKLTAILSADVAGYSRLMAEDESATVKTLETYREVMSTLIMQHRGRVVDSPGDNLLAEFTSVVDAVQCAVAVQKEFQARNAELPENRRMEFRIGVNLGDVIEEGDRIYGDGVNIAARLEALADPGGICVSKTAFDHIESKLPLGYEYLGEQEVKNIPKPVGAYRVLMEPRVTVAEEIEKEKPVPIWRRKGVLAAGVVLVLVVIAALIWNFYFRPPPIEPASVEKMAYPLPDKPSIAVLPFTNIGGDPEQDYFSDGLTEEIITALSKVRKVFVIARNSTFSYKGKAVKVNQVAEELGVRYVLEGSVRKAGDRVRITAQLIDAFTGHHLWGERYDRDLKDIFALQDEITIKILNALQVELIEGEIASVLAKGTKNLEAYLKLLQARKHAFSYTKEGDALCRRLLEEVITIDPGYALAYVGLSYMYLREVTSGSSKSPEESLSRAMELAQKSLSLDDSFLPSRALLCLIYSMKKQHDKAIAEGERAVALNPNHSFGYLQLGGALTNAGRPEEAIGMIKRAIRLDPLPRAAYFRYLGDAYRLAKRHSEAIQAYKKALNISPEYLLAHLGLAATYSEFGREEEAMSEAAEVIKIDPKFSLERFAKSLPYKNQSDKGRYIEILRKAGLPENPPLPLPDKPSIAVLPFVNMSGDPEQEYLSDGMTDTLITDLSKISGLFVIARNSVFTYKGKPVRVEQISRELGVRYVLEGSVQKAGNRLRIGAQLIDASTSGNLWTERYDGKMDDVFALQDKITGKIVTALAVKLTGGEQEQVTRKETDIIAAYDAFLKGWGHYLRNTPEDYARAVSFFEKAVELDPNYSRAYASMALIYSKVLKLGRNWKNALYVFSAVAYRRAKKYLALSMKNPTSTAYLAASFIKVHDRNYEEAISDAERALSLDPNDSACQENMAFVLIMAGRPQEAFAFSTDAMRLDPHNLSNPLYYNGLAYFSMKNFEEAVNSLKRALRYSPKHTDYLLCLAAAYGQLGRDKEAKTTVKLIMETILTWWKGDGKGVGMSGRGMLKDFGYDYPPFKDSEVADLFNDGMYKAGVEETIFRLD